MTGHADWVLGLSADGEVPESSCPELVAEAAKSLGDGPAGWAVLTAARMTEEIVEKVPEHGGGAVQVEVLRRGVEASILLGLRGLLQDMPPTDDRIAGAAVEGAADLARRSVPLDAVLRGVRIGHAFLHRALTDVVDREPEAVRTGEAHRLSELLFAYADVQASRVAEEYLAERARLRADQEVTRRQVVDELLADRPIEPAEASRILAYPVHVCHRAFVLWRESPPYGSTAVHRFCDELARACGADSFLVLPGDSGELWAWAGWESRPPATLVADLKARLSPPEGVGVSIGPAERGPAGMRRSLRWAVECRRVAATLQPGWLCDYTEVWTLSLITSDLERARWYAEETLGALLAPGERVRVLRETLRVYLGCGQSGREAARRLFIARNTVQYRLQRAEEILGRPVAQDPMRLWLALEIARLVPPGDEKETRAAR
jgi:PucR C-terminal helix-turn-helix domain/GGDEF-like domain